MSSKECLFKINKPSSSSSSSSFLSNPGTSKLIS